MNQNQKEKNKLLLFISETSHSLIPVLKSKYLYISLLSVVAGAGLNFASETYLHNYMSEGKTLPMLSDLILDNIPLINVSLVYDIFCLVPIFLVLVYFVHKKDYNRIPLFFLMTGMFYIVRGIFIVLTPFGNPPMFAGSDSLFNGFSKYELGVYPSGHAGNVFLMFLLVKDKGYKWLIFICVADSRAGRRRQDSAGCTRSRAGVLPGNPSNGQAVGARPGGCGADRTHIVNLCPKTSPSTTAPAMSSPTSI